MALAAKKSAPPRRDPRILPKPGIDRLDRLSYLGTMLGWVALLLGQRVFDADDTVGELFTWFGVGAIGASFVQRLMVAAQAKGDRRPIARAFALLSAIGITAFGAYYATTVAGREMFGAPPVKPTEPDLFGDAMTVAWLSLAITSVLPTILGEAARRSMRYAERIEGRRVVAAVVAGLALSFAAVYGGLFTYGGGKLEVDADFSYFRVAKPGALRFARTVEVDITRNQEEMSA